ncbi:helix-turn-helix domain-containing protein [Pirellulaceae bacterium SH467]
MRQAGKMLSVSERSVWSLCQSGQLASFNIGRSVRIPVDAIRKFIVESSDHRGKRQ